MTRPLWRNPRLQWKPGCLNGSSPLEFMIAKRLLVALTACFTWVVYAASPTVTRVEPPNWWVGHSHNPVRLLISGEHLAGAHIEAPTPFKVENLRFHENGTYAFLDLIIPATAQTGAVALHVITTNGRTVAPFEVLQPLPRDNRFRGFSPDDVIYLLMPDRFANGKLENDDPPESPGLLDRSKPRHYHGGDFEGIKQRLPYLTDLGITALWMTPWYDNVNALNHREKYTAQNQRSPRGKPSTDYHGYGATDFYAVEERFGDMNELRELVESAQTAGIKIVQDQVANHTGPYHRWTTNAPTPTWYNGTVENHLDNTWDIWTIAETNPPPDKLKSTLEGWFINILPDLNQNDPETATYLIQNSLWWVGMLGIDAIRQDTLPYVPRQYWGQWTAALKREYPDLTILGEMWDKNPTLVAFFQGGQTQFDGVDSGIETLFDFPLFYAIRDVFANGAPMTRLCETLAADTNYVNSRVLVTFLGLHDTSRFLHESGATHDSLKLAFTFLLTTRGTPLIYYGDEIGLNGGGDPDNRRDFPGGWPDDPANAFEQTGRSPEQEAMHSHVKKLLHLRRDLDPLRRGEHVSLQSDHDTCTYARVSGDHYVVIAINKANDARELAVDLAKLNPSNTRSLVDKLGGLGKVKVNQGMLHLRLPPRTAAVLAP
jgi:neopullulanase